MYRLVRLGDRRPDPGPPDTAVIFGRGPFAALHHARAAGFVL